MDLRAANLDHHPHEAHLGVEGLIAYRIHISRMLRLDYDTTRGRDREWREWELIGSAFVIWLMLPLIMIMGLSVLCGLIMFLVLWAYNMLVTLLLSYTGANEVGLRQPWIVQRYLGQGRGY